MRLNAILFQAAALAIAALPALARWPGAKKRAEHPKAALGSDTSFVRVPSSNLIGSPVIDAQQCIPSSVQTVISYECGAPGPGAPGAGLPPTTVTYTVTRQPTQTPAPPPPANVVTVYVTVAGGQVVPTAVPSPTGAPGSVQTITIFVQGQPQTKTITVGVAPTPLPNYVTITRQAITLAPQNVITKTITLGAPPQPSPTERVYTTVYITEAGQVKPTAVLCPGGAQGAVETLLITLQNQQTITKTITIGVPDVKPTPAPSYATITETLPPNVVTVTATQNGLAATTAITLAPAATITKTILAPGAGGNGGGGGSTVTFTRGA